MKKKFSSGFCSSLRQFHSIFTMREITCSLVLKGFQQLIKKVSQTIYFHCPDKMKAELPAVSLQQNQGKNKDSVFGH